VKLLFIFLDGVGLGEDSPDINPFVHTLMPSFEEILGGHKLIANDHLPGKESDHCLINTERASLVALDACLGIDGIPQSATGQAALFTGVNVPAVLGYHEGPKPTPPIVDLIKHGTLLTQLQQQGSAASLLNAFPPRYFESIKTGYRIPGVIALSVQQAGIHLKTITDLLVGDAISADFTAEGWRDRLGYSNTPVLTHNQAGERLRILADRFDLTIFEYWLTDVVGHHQDMQSACALLESFDAVMGSLFRSWDDENGLILLTSDHGNLEDLSTRHHTRNDVPLLLIGSAKLRNVFIQQMNTARIGRAHFDITDIAPAIVSFIEYISLS
jgi:2,3-bisphosphoglycerate-independent phosphoglycerate mutase